MEKLYFEDFEELAWDAVEKYHSVSLLDEDNDIAIIAKYEDAKQIIQELICIGLDIHGIDIHDEEWDGYDAEYSISILQNEIWCEPLLRDDRYLSEYAPVIYVLDNCSSKVIAACKGKVVYEVTVGEEDCDECECECTCCGDIHIETDGDMHGFSVNHSDENSWSSYSFYSTDMKLVEEMAKVFR